VGKGADAEEVVFVAAGGFLLVEDLVQVTVGRGRWIGGGFWVGWVVS
jgi:hypothetical protein